jgi:xanthine dehydrogenase YagT iron-sulfur-binding subunit
MSNSSKAADTVGPWNLQGYAEESLRPDQHGIELEPAQSSVRNACDWPVSRRNFVKGAGIAVGATVLIPGLRGAESVAEEAPYAQELPLSITVNGERKELKVDARTSLLDLLRENLGLTGTKKGCDHGQCGACTVLAGGRRINSCLALAISYDGDEITSIEGLAQNEAMHPVQQAFLENDGYQCGYCTPGQILSAVALLDEAKKGAASFVTRDLNSEKVELNADEIRERMSGNICRCGAYPGIVAAVRQAGGAKQEAARAEMRGDQNAAI